MDNLLEHFMLEPEREFHIRELAKKAGKSPTTITKYLENYRHKGILICRKKLSHALYKASTESPAFKELKFSYNLRRLRESGLIDFLTDIFNQPEAIILFGSFSKAEDAARSDIDLMVITPIKKQPDLSKHEKILHRRIQLFLHSKAEIEAMKTKNKELLNSLTNGIVIKGYWELFI